jgi:hypothetical protein
LEHIARHLEQRPAHGLGPVDQPVPDQDQPPGIAPADRPIVDLGHVGTYQFNPSPQSVAVHQTLDRFGQSGHHDIGQAQLLPQRQQLPIAKTAVGPHGAQPNMSRELAPQIEEKRGDVAAARGVARAQPQLGHQPSI